MFVRKRTNRFAPEPGNTIKLETAGVHHVTAVAGDPRRNVDFYTETLGLRLVKRTVNFDDPGTYHLYYGDRTGTPGTILTFFPFENGTQGTPGRGQQTATAFVVPDNSFDYWTERFDAHDVAYDEPEVRFGARVLAFRDPDGQPLELVTGESDVAPWDGSDVPAEYGIRGFHGVTLSSRRPDETARVLDLLGYEEVAAEGDRTRFAAAGDRAEYVDLLDTDGPSGTPGAGTVHHVAVRAADGDEQEAWREFLSDAGLNVTAVKDRQYFTSIYFREPGGILFEIATDGPGFDRDESVDSLGSALKLPPWLEDRRSELEARLPSL